MIDVRSEVPCVAKLAVTELDTFPDVLKCISFPVFTLKSVPANVLMFAPALINPSVPMTSS